VARGKVDVPAGTPADVVQAWFTAVQKVLAEDDVRSKLMQAVSRRDEPDAGRVQRLRPGRGQALGALAKASNATAD